MLWQESDEFVPVTGDMYMHVPPEVDQAAADLVAGLVIGSRLRDAGVGVTVSD